MYTNRSSCTVWENTVRDHTPGWTRHETGAVYWEDVTGQSDQGADARAPEEHVFLSIPAASLNGYTPKPDDKVCAGSVTDEAPPMHARTVMNVRGCLHGSPAVQHVEVRAE